MSRTRIVQGKIIKRTGRSYTSYTGARLNRSASGNINERGVKEGIRHQSPEKPDFRFATHHNGQSLADRRKEPVYNPGPAKEDRTL